jgi:SSS family solute:Na+ symporter
MKLPLLDMLIIVIYMIAIVGFGSWFVRKNKTSNDFMIAGNSIPGWAVGLSYFGTYVSSNSFVGIIGIAFGTNWNYFVFSLAIPLAVWIGTKYFVPFYRHGGEISAYHHMEKRFGPWARTYSMICFLLIQVSRIATITFGVALVLNGMTGWSMGSIIIVFGLLTTLYTLLGGIKAVIWTEVVQSVVFFSGAVILFLFIIFGIEGGPSNAIKIASEHSKFSLGSFDLSFSKSTFWVVFLYGLFMNVKAFGFDQTYIQRYHTAKTDSDARKSLWLGILLYVPISLLFFSTGSTLFSYYQTQPDLLNDLKQKSAITLSGGNVIKLDDETTNYKIKEIASTITIREIADQALPHFMKNRLPQGVAGIIIASILAAAMSTLSTCYNSSSTILLKDIYERYIKKRTNDRRDLFLLRIGTLLVGTIGTFISLLMIGVQSILAIWWQLTGIFAGAMLGLFILGFIVKKADRVAAVISVVVGILVIVWVTFSTKIQIIPKFLQSPFHIYMSVVIATLSMFLVGLFVTYLRNKTIQKNN